MTRMLARCVVGMAAVAALAAADSAVAARTRNRTPPPTSDQARERRPGEPEARDRQRPPSPAEGIFELQLPVGTHRIEVTTPGYRAYTGTIEIHDDEHTPPHVSLARDH